MSDLVVFYSLTGKSRQVAEKLASALPADLAEIVEEKPRGFTGLAMIRCLTDSLLRRKPAIKPMAKHAGVYDRVTLVCPIWAARIAGPARSWLAVEGPDAPVLALSLQLGGGPHGSVFDEIAALTGKSPEKVLEVVEGDFAENKAMDKVEAFAHSMRGAPQVAMAA
jgi:hypothetical protein